MSSDAPAIQPAAAALSSVLTFAAPADAVLRDFFRQPPRLGSKGRAFVAEAVFGVLRHLRTLQAAGARKSPRMLVLAWLVREHGFSVRRLESVAREKELPLLESIKAFDATTLSLAERAELPDWLFERLLTILGDEEAVLRFGRAMQHPAPMDLRVNLAKTTRDSALAALTASGIDALPTPFSPAGIRVGERTAIQQHPLFLSGDVEVQDEGSQLLAWLVQPRRGEMVADFCAGAGGKTLALGALMRSTGRLYAFDVSTARLAKLRPRLARSGLSNVHPQAIAVESDAKLKRLAGKFDRVLVDAPCSGTGTLRRNPDLKWRQSPESVTELAGKQVRILAAAAKLVKPSGRLVYATCSLLPEENEGVVDAFLAAQGEFGRVAANEVLARQRIALDTGAYLRLDPLSHGTDGFFAAVFERAG